MSEYKTSKIQRLEDTVDSHDVVEYVGDFIRSQAKFKEARTAFQQLCEDYYEGRQWYRFRQRDGRIVSDEEIRRGIVVNVTRNVVDLSTAAMVSDRFVLDATTLGKLPEDYRASHVASTILSDIFHRNGGFRRQQEVAKTTKIRGDHFVRVEIDSSALDSLSFANPDALQAFMNETGKSPVGEPTVNSAGRVMATFRVGHVVERDLNACNVLVPNDIQNFSDARNFAICYYKPISTIRALAQSLYEKNPMEGVDPERIKPVDIRDVRAINNNGDVIDRSYAFTYDNQINVQEGYRRDTEAFVGQVCEYYEQDSHGYWQCVYLTNADYKLYMGGRGGLLQHPIVRIPGWRIPSRFWSLTEISDYSPLQIVLNKLRIHQINYMRNSVKDYFVTTKGSKATVMNNQTGPTIVEYEPRGSHPPEFHTAGSAHLAELTAIQERVKAEIYELGRINEVMQGNAPDRTSGQTVQMLQTNGLRTLQMFWEGIKQAYTEIAEKEINLVRNSKEFPVSRIAAMTGLTGFIGADEFKYGDERGRFRYTTRPDTAQAMTQKELFNGALQLAQYGYFDPTPEAAESRSLMNDWMENGGKTKFIPEVQRFNEATAVREFQVIASGNFEIGQTQELGEDGVPFFLPRVFDLKNEDFMFQQYQEHEIHLEEHGRMVQDPRTDPSVRQVLLLHIEEHRFYLAQLEMEAREQALRDQTEQSIAEGASNTLNTALAAEADKQKQSAADKRKTPSQGGKKSGKVRSAS